MFSPQKQNSFLNGGIIEKLLTVGESAHFYPKSHYYTTASFVEKKRTARNLFYIVLEIYCKSDSKFSVTKRMANFFF